MIKTQILWTAGVYAVATLLLFLLGGVETAGRVLVIGGLLTVVVVQIVGLMMINSRNSPSAALSVVVPGYFLFALKREGFYGIIVGIYFAGLLSVMFGTVALS